MDSMGSMDSCPWSKPEPATQGLNSGTSSHIKSHQVAGGTQSIAPVFVTRAARPSGVKHGVFLKTCRAVFCVLTCFVLQSKAQLKVTPVSPWSFSHGSATEKKPADDPDEPTGLSAILKGTHSPKSLKPVGAA